MSDLALSVRGLTKEYQILHNAERHNRVTDAMADSVRGLFRKKEVETFRALDDVSFDVKKGEVLGVIGRNGAGKSTLLKILSRITEPTSGEIHLYGRVGSLLEVGTGFHPELTGRENIYLNGAILGMRKKEIDRQFDAIVDFAEVEKFLDTPVKRYSSGMYVRLAFAVAAHLNPEILIVDEVLAVGDAQFQKKCLGKMQDVSRQEGRTVLFVSHNMGVVRGLCTRAILMGSGRIESIGDSYSVTSTYQANQLESKARTATTSSKGITFHGFELVNHRNLHTPEFAFNEPAKIVLRFESPSPTVPIILALSLKDEEGNRIMGLWGPEEGIDFQIFHGDWAFNLKIDRMSLFPGRYFLDIALNDNAGEPHYSEFDAISFTVSESPLVGAPRAYQSGMGRFRFVSALAIERPVKKNSSLEQLGHAL